MLQNTFAVPTFCLQHAVFAVYFFFKNTACAEYSTLTAKADSLKLPQSFNNDHPAAGNVLFVQYSNETYTRVLYEIRHIEQAGRLKLTLLTMTIASEEEACFTKSMLLIN